MSEFDNSLAEVEAARAREVADRLKELRRKNLNVVAEWVTSVCWLYAHEYARCMALEIPPTPLDDVLDRYGVMPKAHLRSALKIIREARN
jgi:hypothetical protein